MVVIALLTVVVLVAAATNKPPLRVTAFVKVVLVGRYRAPLASTLNKLEVFVEVTSARDKVP